MLAASPPPSMVRAPASVVAVISMRTGRMWTRRAPWKSPVSSSVDVRRELPASIYFLTARQHTYTESGEDFFRIKR